MHIFANTTRFAVESMLAGGEVAFEDMTHPQLKDELVARGEARSGLKHVLQRLHALLVCRRPSRRGGRTQR